MGLAEKVTKIGKLTTIYTISGLIPYILGFVVSGPIFTRYLSTQEYDIFALAGRVMDPISILIQLGVIQSFKSYFFRVREAQRPQFVKTMLVGQMVQMGILCGLASVLGIWIAGPLLPNLPLDGRHTYLLFLMVIWGCFLTAIVRLGTGLMTLLERGFSTAGLNTLNYMAQLGFGIVAVVWLGWQGFGRQGTILMGLVVAAVPSLWVMLRYAKGRFDVAEYRGIMKTGLTFIPHTLSASLAVFVNSWLLKHFDFKGSGLLSIYSQAIAYSAVLAFPLGSFNSASYPTLAKMMSDGSPEARRQQSRLYTLLAMGFAFVALAVSLLSPPAIKILIGKEFRGAAMVSPILVLGYLFQGLYMIAGNPVFFVGGGLWMAAASASSLLANVILSFLLIPRYGMYGAAWAMVGCFVVQFAVIAWISQKKYPLPWQIGPITRGLGAAVGLGLVDYFVASRFSLSLPVSLAIKFLLLAAMIPLIRLTGVLSAAEIARAKQLVLGKVMSIVNRKPRAE